MLLLLLDTVAADAYKVVAICYGLSRMSPHYFQRWTQNITQEWISICNELAVDPMPMKILQYGSNAMNVILFSTLTSHLRFIYPLLTSRISSLVSRLAI